MKRFEKHVTSDLSLVSSSQFKARIPYFPTELERSIRNDFR